MKLENMHELLGLTDQDQALLAAVKEHGGTVDKLSKSKLSELGSDFVYFSQQGVDLAFNSPESFQNDYQKQPRGPGPFVLACIFYYATKSSKHEAYTGPAPFFGKSFRNREEALAVCGKPDHTELDDGEIWWDDWNKDGVSFRATYRDGAELKDMSVSFPYKG